MMTSRERLKMTISGKIPDHVPVSPDISNMLPAKMTGRPFWDIYLYEEIPSWKAYIDAAKYFGFDSLMDGYVKVAFEELGEVDSDHHEAIVLKDDRKITTRGYRKINNKLSWDNTVAVYFKDNPPMRNITLENAGVDKYPNHFEDVIKRNPYPQGEALIKIAKDEMGDHGLVGIFCGGSCAISTEEEIYDYYDNPEKYIEIREKKLKAVEKRFEKLMSLSSKPDFICTGGSGTLVFQTLDMFKELALPIVKRVTQLCKEHSIPSHIHSCGPETELVKICYEETNLTVIDPLEIPPMGDSSLKELKKLYGDRLILKGNLHTTNVMLNGSVNDVIAASRAAIDDGAKGGRFILSTGDQCGRDTPFENIFAMIETAKTYGSYEKNASLL